MLEVINDSIVKAYVATTNKIIEFKNSEKGVTAVEYAIVVAGVAAVVAVIFNKSGPVQQMLDNIFTNVGSQVKANLGK